MEIQLTLLIIENLNQWNHQYDNAMIKHPHKSEFLYLFFLNINESRNMK